MRRALIFLALLASTASAAQEYPPYPDGNALIASSGNVANAVATATLPATAGKINYLTSVFITAGGATAAAVVTCTITGVKGGTITFIFGAPLAVGTMAAPLSMEFPASLPASAVNTAIVVSCPALGTGNTRMAIIVTGYMK